MAKAVIKILSKHFTVTRLPPKKTPAMPLPGITWATAMQMAKAVIKILSKHFAVTRLPPKKIPTMLLPGLA